MSRFAHLHVHTHYSLLEALPKIDELVEAAKADGQTALAITDHGNLYGAIEFYKECVNEGIKPIIGVDFFVAPRGRADSENNIDNHFYKLVLLVKNEVGYGNILKLVTKSFTEGFFERPRIDLELMKMHGEGLVCIIPAHGGEHMRHLEAGDKVRAKEVLIKYREIFGSDCYAEITRHSEIPQHDARMKELIGVARDAEIPLVAAQNVQFMKSADGAARELVDKIRLGETMHREVEVQYPDFSFTTISEMERKFADIPEALENAALIAEACTLTLTLGKAIFPVYPLPEGADADEELLIKADAGISMRGLDDTPDLRTRIDYELGIIKQKGYAPYFLIVADLLNYASSVGIQTNTRGSAAGSLVSYLCGITTVDPIKFQMPFERFLNPERPSAPDIDMDIADDRRDELIEYARRKYGDDHVVQIGTFGTMMARAAVRDVSRALGHSYGTGDALAKMIPFPKQGFPVTIKSALETTPELLTAYKKDPTAREILDFAQAIEGNARHVGVHAAGVVISPRPVIEYTPIQPDPKGGKTISQYDMYSIADEYGGVGLLKFDFLGLKNLSVLAKAKDRVRNRLNVEVDLNRLPLDDRKVFEMLTRGETLGVFQMAGSGMTAYLKDLRPTLVEDLNAMVALYRPGPMAFIPEYIARKRNPALVKYLDPRLEKILKPTYGVLIYQDDVMLMAVQLAGYSWGDADKFRKAMGKKIPEEMAKQKDRFLSGCLKGGMKESAATKLWEQIETFAAYGFNKAHAASYGNLAYKTAYMKANFPVDYMAAVLTADAGDVEQIAEIVAETKRMKLRLLPPSVISSFGEFTVIDDSEIRFGLYSVKNFGTGVADAIIAARKSGGPFTDLADFLTRVADKNLNKRQLESLIKGGALDELGERGELLANMESLITFHKEATAAPSSQGSLFSALPRVAELRLTPAPAANMDTKLEWEKELLGYYISGHPLDKYRPVLEKQKMTINEAKQNFPKGIATVIGGFLQNVKPILTKKGDKMMFGDLTDFTGGIEIVVFPKTYTEFSALLTQGNCVALKGQFNSRNGQASFVVDKVKMLG